MKPQILVLGAGMVGTCTALHLQARGFEAVLVDRKSPGQETSYGNSGIIQQESVEPYAMPRDAGFLLQSVLGLRPEIHWHANALLPVLPALWSYFHHSAPTKHALITQAYSKLIAHATREHQPFITQSNSEDLIQRQGFRFIYRTDKAFDTGTKRAQKLLRNYGVRSCIQDSKSIALAEPALQQHVAGAIHWLDPWSVSDPGALVQRYAKYFDAQGGHVILGDAKTLRQQGSGWQVNTAEGSISAPQVVLALGPWSHQLVKRMGYNFPLFIKRGYHQHYDQPKNIKLTLLDAENGFVLAPMQQGIRLTTGAEFAKLDAAPTPVQLQKTESIARALLGLDQVHRSPPWLGSRPCTADMLPIIGAAPNHKGLWFNFGHGHQGFTLGPVSGRLLAELISKESTVVDAKPYSPLRFAS